MELNAPGPALQWFGAPELGSCCVVQYSSPTWAAGNSVPIRAFKQNQLRADGLQNAF